MQYRLLSKIAPQCNDSGFVEHINLSSFQSESLQIPGFGKIANMSTFYLPLRGSSSPYQQNKTIHKEELVAPVINIKIAPETETITKSQTGFRKTDLVLESLNETQKHKLEDNVYEAMTNPVIKIKKAKFNPVSVSEKPKLTPKLETNAIPAQKDKIGKGAQKAKKIKTAHKFNVI